MHHVWTGEAQAIEKINALIIDDKRIFLGGLSKDGKGVIEIWDKTSTS